MKKIYIVFLFINLRLNSIDFILNFNHYMQNSEYFDERFTKYNAEWEILKEQFNKIKKLEFNLIPRKIHQIWLGSPLPKKYEKLQQSWIKNHPNWEYKLWTEKEVIEFKLKNLELYNSTNNYGEKSDIVRYEILYRIGGIYVDCDFECLKSFENIIHLCDFFAGVGYGSNPIILSGIIGSIPGHPILKTCIEDIKKENNIENYIEILNRTSIFYFTRCFFKSFTSKSIIFPVTFLYPLPDSNKDEKEIFKYIKSESYAIHYWHLSWNQGKMY